MPGPVATHVPLPPEALTRRLRKNRTLFLSDLHLGTSRGRPAHVVDFLAHNAAERLFLVGDIFDGWNPTKRRSSPGPDHRLLLGQLDKLAEQGTQIVMVPGNHDAGFRRMSGQTIGPVQICEETHHTLADGRRLLITHGDSVDPLMTLGPMTGWLGGKADIVIRKANARVNAWRTALGAQTSSWVEDQLMRINTAMHPRATYATRLTTRARDLGFDGVICGHYHIPALSQISGTLYANCGDWLDHFSAVTETAEGALHLIRWPELAAAPAASLSPLPQGSLPVA